MSPIMPTTLSCSYNIRSCNFKFKDKNTLLPISFISIEMGALIGPED